MSDLTLRVFQGTSRRRDAKLFCHTSKIRFTSCEQVRAYSKNVYDKMKNVVSCNNDFPIIEIFWL